MKIKEINDRTLSVFVPMQIRRKKGYVTIILPKDSEKYKEIENPKNYNERLVKAFAKAYKWKIMFQEKKANTFDEIAKIEGTEKSYVAKIFKLNYVAPNIIKNILSGKQPENLKLRDFTAKAIPDLWEEQMEVFGF